MAEEIRVPSLGESVTEATIAKWLKKAGDQVEQDEPIAELETDKVAMEVNAPEAGVLSEILVAEGEDVEVGTVIAKLDVGAQASKEDSGSRGTKADAGSDDSDTDEADEADEAESDGADASGGGKMVDVTVPESGESVTEADIASWLKQKGEAVEQDEPIAELETDKAAMEVPAPAAGVLAEILAEAGSTVSPGDVIARIEKGAKAGKSQKKPDQSGAAKTTPQESAKQDGGGKATPADSGGKADDAQPMAPSVRRLLSEYNLDPKSVDGSGKDGRITKADVLGAIDAGTARTLSAGVQPPAPSSPEQDMAATAPREERIPMTRMRKRIAERLKDAQNTAAMLTTFNDVDMSAVKDEREKYRDLFEKKHGVRLGFMSFFVKAAVLALREVPEVNARIDQDEIVYQNFYDIGVAVSGPKGLVVPVLRDADRLSFADTEKQIGDFGRKARDGKLTVGDLQGGTFSISNGGIFGSMLSTPILNPPQSAILGMHRIEDRPVAIGGKVEIRPMMYLALSYDHRLIDGREAVTFLRRMKEAIEDPSRLLLDL